MCKKAFVVGINAYKPRALRGCVVDAVAVRTLLASQLGFADNRVELMLDTSATRQGVEHGLQRLVAGAAPGDTLLFYFAGCGTTVATAPGTEEAAICAS